MNTSEMNFLKFRTELIELLKKYNCSISGTGFDDGSINVDFKDTYYILSGEQYKPLDGGWNNLSGEYIKDMFPEKLYHTLYQNDKIGIFTENYNKAKNILDNLYQIEKENIEKYIITKNDLQLIYKNGKTYILIKPNDMSRGRKVGVAYIDANLTLNQLYKIVIPCCIYCVRSDIIII